VKSLVLILVKQFIAAQRRLNANVVGKLKGESSLSVSLRVFYACFGKWGQEIACGVLIGWPQGQYLRLVWCSTSKY
jgi:hypothetical protein